MKSVMLCYADENMYTSQVVCMKSAMDKGDIDFVHMLRPANFDAHFYLRHAKILDAPQRGGGKGFWLFKPYFCEQVVRQEQEGTFVVYADSGVKFISSLTPIFEQMEKTNTDIFLFGNGHRHIDWCKLEVLCHMLRLDPTDKAAICYDYKIQEQAQASVIIFRVNEFTRKFCSEWLSWSTIPGMIDDQTEISQLPEFREHRNDQSILTNLAIKYSVPLHWWPVQYGHSIRHKYLNDKYQQLFYHHRYRESDWSISPNPNF